MNTRRITDSKQSPLFDFFFGDIPPKFVQNTEKRYNVYRDQDKIVLEFALAGFKKEEIEAKLLENSVLMINARKQSQDEALEYLYKGISDKSVSYQFSVPNVEVLSTVFENGILSITLLKHQKKETLLQIE